VKIERVLINGIPVDPVRQVRLPADQGNLAVQYSAVNFSAPEKLRFRYKLAGIDQDWIEAGVRRTAYYTHLPPGLFIFSVIAANKDGVWSPVQASQAITVVPPLWATWWFRFLAVASAAAAAAYIYSWRIAGLRAVHQRQLEFSRQLIESQELERRRIAAELHDSLGQTLAVIRNRALISLKSAADHRKLIEQLDEISDAASHALEEVREIAYELRPYQLDQLGLAKAVEIMLKKVSTEDRLRFTTKIEGLTGALSPDQETNIYRIIQESVNNIIKHSNATLASIKIMKQGNQIETVVTDNGIGFSAPREDRLAEPGLGLKGMIERARLIGGSLSISTKPGSGTTVRMVLRLPQ